MALLVCPDCKKKVSETAKVCPKCGFSLTPEAIKRIKDQGVSSRAGGCLLLLLLVLGYGIWKLFTPANPAPTPQSLRQAMDSSRSDADEAKLHCNNLRAAQERTEGLLAENASYVAEAKLLDGGITAKQERRIRSELSDEMHLLPSQIEGWRTILKGRADTARAEEPRLNAQRDREKADADNACVEAERADAAYYRAADVWLKAVGGTR